MKAVFLLQTDPYRPKPVLRALREADTLHRQGWDVAFVSWIKAAAPPTDEPSGPYLVRRVVVPVPALGTSFVQRALAYYRATSRMSRACVDEKPDLIVAHDFEVLRAGAMAKRRASKPLIYDSHEDWPALIAENSALEARIARAQEKRLCRCVARVITVSEPIAAKFRARGTPTTVLYNARSSSEVVLAGRDASRSNFGFVPTDFVVGFAGAFGIGRGLDILLEALSTLPPSVKVLLVGGPEEEGRRLRAMVETLGFRDRVRVDGYRSFRDLGPYYASMDLGVILLDRRPNHQRALPNKLFDYMAHGVPVLVPDYPAMRSVVRESECGWCLASVDRRALVEILTEVQTSDERVARGENGRRAFLERFSWERQELTFSRIVDTLVRTH